MLRGSLADSSGVTSAKGGQYVLRGALADSSWVTAGVVTVSLVSLRVYPVILAQSHFHALVSTAQSRLRRGQG